MFLHSSSLEFEIQYYQRTRRKILASSAATKAKDAKHKSGLVRRLGLLFQHKAYDRNRPNWVDESDKTKGSKTEDAEDDDDKVRWNACRSRMLLCFTTRSLGRKAKRKEEETNDYCCYHCYDRHHCHDYDYYCINGRFCC